MASDNGDFTFPKGDAMAQTAWKTDSRYKETFEGGLAVSLVLC